MKKKIKVGVLYHVPTREDFRDFMCTAEAQGFHTYGGGKPTSVLDEYRLESTEERLLLLLVDKSGEVSFLLPKVEELPEFEKDIILLWHFDAKGRRVKCKAERRVIRDRVLMTLVVVLLMAVVALCAMSVRGVIRAPWTLIAVLPTCVLAAVAMYFLLCKREEDAF